MGTVARHDHATDNVKSEGVQKVFSRLVRRKQNLPVSESAKALACVGAWRSDVDLNDL
jgi:hypothetical protein